MNEKLYQRNLRGDLASARLRLKILADSESNHENFRIRSQGVFYFTQKSELSLIWMGLISWQPLPAASPTKFNRKILFHGLVLPDANFNISINILPLPLNESSRLGLLLSYRSGMNGRRSNFE